MKSQLKFWLVNIKIWQYGIMIWQVDIVKGKVIEGTCHHKPHIEILLVKFFHFFFSSWIMLYLVTFFQILSYLKNRSLFLTQTLSKKVPTDLDDTSQILTSNTLAINTDQLDLKKHSIIVLKNQDDYNLNILHRKTKTILN